MENQMELAGKFIPVMGGVYKAESKTAVLDSTTRMDSTGANEIKVLNVQTTGLGDYSREGGYPKGEVTATWDTLTLSKERGKELSVDRMDDEESIGLTFGTVVGEFMRTHVVPELDAYRFAEYASATDVSWSYGKLDVEKILGAIDEASRKMDEDEVPGEGRRLFVNSDLKPMLNKALARSWTSESKVASVIDGYNDMPIIYVPSSRFFTGVKLYNGSGDDWGFTQTNEASPINFMMIHPSAVLQVVKFAMPKIFDPDTNQEKDAWKFQFRVYHDAFVRWEKNKGVYLHKLYQ